MLIIRYSGGLGNQMFQYALGIVLQHDYPNIKIKADLEHFKLYKVHNGFEIEKCFNVSLSKASVREIRRVSDRFALGVCINFLPPAVVNTIERLYFKYRKKTKNIIRQEEFNSFNKKIFDGLEEKEDYYVEGEWQNWKYFEENETLLLDAFRFKRKVQFKQDFDWLNQIKCSNSVSIHVRRGDFVNSDSHNLCDQSYYESAISYIKERVQNPRFFIFSDDIDYAKKVFGKLNAVYVVHSKRDADMDMQLMSMCKHNIIPNSTFSFWAAFLNPNRNKIVVYPKFFLKRGTEWIEFLAPKEWKKINNRENIDG